MRETWPNCSDGSRLRPRPPHDGTGGGAEGPPDEGAEHAVEAVGGADLGGQVAVQMLGLALIDGGEELAPVGEVLVDERAAHPCSLGDRVHRHGVDLAGGDELGGGVEQGVAPVGAGEPGGLEGFGVGRLGAPCARFRHGDIVSPRR